MVCAQTFGPVRHSVVGLVHTLLIGQFSVIPYYACAANSFFTMVYICQWDVVTDWLCNCKGVPFLVGLALVRVRLVR